MDRLEVLRLDGVGADAIIGVQLRGDVAHHVLDEFRVVVGAFGHVFLVRALEQTEQFARGLFSTTSISSSIQMKSQVRTVSVT